MPGMERGTVHRYRLLETDSDTGTDTDMDTDPLINYRKLWSLKE